MSILLHPSSEPQVWFDALTGWLPEHRISLWPDSPDPDDVTYLLAWRHDLDLVARYSNLKAILCLGAGVEQFVDDRVPEVPIVRLTDPAMADEMAVYSVHWVTHFQRRFDVMLADQRQADWSAHSWTPAPQSPVGILGHGVIGGRIGRAFADLGHPVHAWSRSRPHADGVIGHAGPAELAQFLGSVDAVVNVLPATADTRDLMNADRFAHCRPGTTYVNLGRGATTSESDLVDALDAGHLGAAVLDVTSVEPLPSDSPLWRHPKVRLTPHIAGATQVGTAAQIVAENIKLLDRGMDPVPVFRRERGY